MRILYNIVFFIIIIAIIEIGLPFLESIDSKHYVAYGSFMFGVIMTAIGIVGISTINKKGT